MSTHPTEIECVQCGAPNPLTAKVCEHCGAPLPASETTQRMAPSKLALPIVHPRHGRATRRLPPKGFGDLPLHAVVAKRYEVIQQFNSQPDVNAYVAVNVQSQKQRILYESANPKQFEREQNWITYHLQHPALIEMEDAFQVSYGDHTRAYLAVEFPLTPAASLARCSEPEILTQAIQLGHALALAHDHGLFNASISSGSLFVSDKQIKLWGSAAPTELTPESRAQDVYQLASALYQLATEPGQTAPTFSPLTLRVFESALAPDARSRYPNAHAFCGDLQKALDALSGGTNFTTVVGRLSDIGSGRECDEDALLTIELAQHTQEGSRTIGLYAVADGMGGASAGEVASRIVVQTLARHVTQTILEPGFGSADDTIDYAEILRAAAEQANLAVFNARQEAKTGMGSTLVAALLVGAQAYIANVGDSRGYVLSPQNIRKITKDHSLVQSLIDREMISEAEARTHPQRNYITRNMGDKAQVEVDLVSATLEPGQYLLLCCDGLWEMVEDAEIHRLVLKARDPQEACRRLIDTANAHGGGDNITCVLVHLAKSSAG